MDKLTSNLNQKAILIIAVFGLAISIVPGIYVVPVDFFAELITGNVPVDITPGLATYFLVLPILVIVVVFYVCHLKFIKNNQTRLPRVLIFISIAVVLTWILRSGLTQ